MPVTLPFAPTTPPTPIHYTSAVLDGATYRFRVRWNGRAEAWYLDIRTADGTALALGVKVVLGTALARWVRSPLWPAGILFATDDSGEGRDATYDDFGVRIKIVFMTFDEIVELRTS